MACGCQKNTAARPPAANVVTSSRVIFRVTDPAGNASDYPTLEVAQANKPAGASLKALRIAPPA
jgi:hypothetical protein